MEYLHILWDDPDDPLGNVHHIADHDLAMEDVEAVLENPMSDGISDTSGRPCVGGYTLDGQYIIVIYDKIDEDTIRVVTAYEVPEPW